MKPTQEEESTASAGDSADSDERRDALRRQRRQAVRLADLSTVGLVFPVAIILGYFAGRFIGGFFGAEEGGGLIGGGFGLVAGFYNVYKTALMLQRQDES